MANLTACPKCNIEKSDNEFYAHKSRSTGRSAHCKVCTRESQNEYRRKNPDIIRNNNYNFMYGISLEDYNKMFADQAGCCAICKKHQNEFTKKLAVDHCHETGKVRALLCAFCNTSLGNMNDDIELLKSAIDYLEKHQ